MIEQRILYVVEIATLIVIALIIVIECRPKRAREKAQADAQMAYIEAECEVNKLKAENERLRSCLSDAAENRRLVMGEYKQLREENAKLRELAEKAWKTAERLCQAFDGPCRDDGTTIYKPCPLGERNEECVYGLIQRDLRELGVEV